MRAWVNSSASRLSCDILHSLCICRLSLTCISSEISTKIEECWLILTAGLMPTGLFCCPVLTANCPSASPVANSFSGFLCPTPLTRVPLPTSSYVEISSPNSLFDFAPKQTKGSSAWRTTYIVSHYVKLIAILAADFVNACVGQGISVFGVILYNFFCLFLLCG